VEFHLGYFVFGNNKSLEGMKVIAEVAEPTASIKSHNA
jgi:hypothetical protein